MRIEAVEGREYLKTYMATFKKANFKGKLYVTSLYNIHTLSSQHVMRILKLIRYELVVLI